MMARRSARLACAAAFSSVLGMILLHSGPACAGDYRDVVKKGREAFVSQCLNCHQTVDDAVGGYRTKPSLDKVVGDMIDRGAKLDREQREAVVEYLSGRMLLVAKCSSCHTVNRPLAANKSLENWRSTVESMARKMPRSLGMTSAQIDSLAVFLSVERPPLE